MTATANKRNKQCKQSKQNKQNKTEQTQNKSITATAYNYGQKLYVGSKNNQPNRQTEKAGQPDRDKE